MRHFQWLLFVIMLGMFSGCAVTGKNSLSPLDPTRVNQAEDAWTRFLNASRSAEVQASPFRISANLHYAGDEGTQRVSAYFWGNGGEDPYPLRLDVQAGMGSIMAAVREDAAYFAAYVPSDKTLYLSPQGEGSLQAFDVPVPFSLADLALLFTGRYGELFLGPNYEKSALPPVFEGANGSFRFRLTGVAFPGYLDIGSDGLPVSWTEEDGWTISIDYRMDSTRTTPRRVRFTHAEGREATVVVRELARPAPFGGQQLELGYPEGTQIRILQPR